jgi:hypothetical protein
MKEQPAFVGGIVHFVWPIGPSTGIHMAAIIVETWQTLGCRHPANATPEAKAANRMQVILTVFTTMGDNLLVPVAGYDEEGSRLGSWHWPEDVVEEME